MTLRMMPLTSSFSSMIMGILLSRMIMALSSSSNSMGSRLSFLTKSSRDCLTSLRYSMS